MTQAITALRPLLKSMQPAEMLRLAGYRESMEDFKYDGINEDFVNEWWGQQGTTVERVRLIHAFQCQGHGATLLRVLVWCGAIELNAPIERAPDGFEGT